MYHRNKCEGIGFLKDNIRESLHDLGMTMTFKDTKAWLMKK